MLYVNSCLRIFTIGLVMVTLMSNSCGSAEPIRYHLRFPAPQTHYVEVEARVPFGGASEVELMMAVWTPGSYLVREYARHLEELSAARPRRKRARTRQDPQEPLEGDRPVAQAEVKVTYRVYGRTMSVQGNWVDGSFAHAQRRGDVLDPGRLELARPHEVALELPPGWQTSVTGLPGGRRPAATPLRRGRLRHAGRFADLRRQSGGLRVPG